MICSSKILMAMMLTAATAIKLRSATPEKRKMRGQLERLKFPAHDMAQNYRAEGDGKYIFVIRKAEGSQLDPQNKVINPPPRTLTRSPTRRPRSSPSRRLPRSNKKDDYIKEHYTKDGFDFVYTIRSRLRKKFEEEEFRVYIQTKDGPKYLRMASTGQRKFSSLQDHAVNGVVYLWIGLKSERAVDTKHDEEDLPAPHSLSEHELCNKNYNNPRRWNCDRCKYSENCYGKDNVGRRYCDDERWKPSCKNCGKFKNLEKSWNPYPSAKKVSTNTGTTNTTEKVKWTNRYGEDDTEETLFESGLND